MNKNKRKKKKIKNLNWNKSIKTFLWQKVSSIVSINYSQNAETNKKNCMDIGNLKQIFNFQ